MTSSCCHSKSGARFFSLFARNYRKRFQKKGLEPSEKQLMAGLEKVGFGSASILDVGCGVGQLHQLLLEQGAASATGIDLAPRMLAEAEDWANERGLADRVRYISGDFMELDDEIEPADICLLDKVVCCYPDAPGMLAKSLSNTRRVYALTYPRDRWFVRWFTRVWNFGFWLLRSDFRSFVHDPEQIENRIADDGFDKRFEDVTASWLTQVYVRS